MTKKADLTFALDRISQSIEARKAEIERQLDRKDLTAPATINQGRRFAVVGTERSMLGYELDHLRSLTAYIAEANT